MRPIVEHVQSYALTLQVFDAVDRFAGEQLLASNMEAGEHRDRRAVVELADDVRREGGDDVGAAVQHVLHVREAGLELGIADLGEAFGADQVLGNRDRCAAGHVAEETGGGDLRRSVVGERPPRAQDASCARCGQGGEKIAARLLSRGLGGFTLCNRHGGQVAWKAVPDLIRMLRQGRGGNGRLRSSPAVVHAIGGLDGGSRADASLRLFPWPKTVPSCRLTAE